MRAPEMRSARQLSLRDRPTSLWADAQLLFFRWVEPEKFSNRVLSAVRELRWNRRSTKAELPSCHPLCCPVVVCSLFLTSSNHRRSGAELDSVLLQALCALWSISPQAPMN